MTSYIRYRTRDRRPRAPTAVTTPPNKANPLEAKLDAFGRFCVLKRVCRNSTELPTQALRPKEGFAVTLPSYRIIADDLFGSACNQIQESGFRIPKGNRARTKLMRQAKVRLAGGKAERIE